MKTKTCTSVSGRMETKRLIIERLTEGDFEFFCEIANDSVVSKYFASWNDVENMEEFFKNEILLKQDSGCLFLVIRQKSDLMPVGFFNALYYNDCGASSWLIEYALLESYRKHGYITELLSYICENDFEFLSIFRTNKTSLSTLIFEVKSDNLDSIRVIKKLSSNSNYSLTVGKHYYYIDID